MATLTSIRAAMNDFVPLARRTGESADDWSLRLLDDLTIRFRSSSHVLVETYLQQISGLKVEMEVALDLVTAEWTLRRMTAENFTLNEYLLRFPEWASDLRLLWEIDKQTLPPSALPERTTRAVQDWTGSTTLPAIFGGYRLLQEFSGGMAHVFLAEPLAGGAAVALKTPKLPAGRDAKTLADHTSRRERFLREARLVQRLEGPGVCQVIEVGECEGIPYFTMPFYPGKSIRDELHSRGPFADRDAAKLIAGVACAVQIAHDVGILHRDIKPANLLRDTDGQVVITDFGLAIPLNDDELRLTVSGNTPGTPIYFSPEQAQGQRDLTPASDIFSLGVVLYELLAGCPPFAGNIIELLRAITEAAPAPLQEPLSPAIVAICSKAMAKKPGDRYASMTAFAEDLERFLAGTWTPPVTLAPPSVDLTPRLPQRWIAAWIALGFALLLGVVAALWTMLANRQAPDPDKNDDEPQTIVRPLVSTRKPVGLHGQLKSLHDDLVKLDKNNRDHFRYFSLMAVHDNPYISDADLNMHEAALQRVLNRLSKDKLQIRIHHVEGSGCLLRIDLRELGWHAGLEWSDLLKVEPYGVRYDAVNPDERVRELAHDIVHLTASLDAPYLRADWFIVAAIDAPLFDHLQQLDPKARSGPAFDLSDKNDSIARVAHLYKDYIVDGRVATAELGLGTVAGLDAQWPADKTDLRKSLAQPLSRNRWAGDGGNALFADCVRTLNLGVPHAIQPLR